MKSKNIPADIRAKSIKEAQKEIKYNIENLENTKANLDDSIEQYNRMIQLNHHIQEQFRRKASEIKKNTAYKKKKKISKNKQ